MNPMLKIAYDYGCQKAIEDLEKTAGPALNRLFSDLSGTAGAGLAGALAGGVGGGLSSYMDDEDILRGVLTGAGGGAVAGSLGTALQKRLRGDDLDNSLSDYEKAERLLGNRQGLDMVHKAYKETVLKDLDKELSRLSIRPSRANVLAARNIQSNMRDIRNEPTSIFGQNKFDNAEDALINDLSANKARAIASALLPGGLGALGGYGLNELIED